MAFLGLGKKDTPRTEVELADVARYIQPDPLCPTLAEDAYSDLVRLQRLELVNVYLPAGWVAAGHRRFNVWLEATRERVTLEQWCARWVASRAIMERESA